MRALYTVHGIVLSVFPGRSCSARSYTGNYSCNYVVNVIITKLTMAGRAITLVDPCRLSGPAGTFQLQMLLIIVQLKIYKRFFFHLDSGMGITFWAENLVNLEQIGTLVSGLGLDEVDD